MKLFLVYLYGMFYMKICLVWKHKSILYVGAMPLVEGITMINGSLK
jgi:hypothetical protein